MTIPLQINSKVISADNLY